MGQAANNRSRRASLDDRKIRAAGREDQAVRGQIRDASAEQFAKGKTGGASGVGRRASGRASGRAAAAAGSGGAAVGVGRSTRPARKRGA